ncbi:hypothetical protein ACFL6Y_07825 [Elusimicrobiota bacterium]
MIIVAGFASIILHNLISGSLATEEPFLFIFVVIILPAYVLICAIYSLAYFLKRKKG